ncbi:MAG: beta-propeller fold lactonase family protein [Clostridiales bacterium]|nr:beta-propeller fold lactonase family protein [Clostridiales bacterium]MDY2835761.1 beta-propeller fold lactonase family protein [Candidatus Aphodomonas sp.]
MPDGTLTRVDSVPCGGKTPRDFDIDPTGRCLICGNQDSDNITVFAIDGETGRLNPVFACDAPTPVCIKPVWMNIG